MKSYGSANIKIALLITGVIIIIATLIYTQILVGEILDREREVANLYAKSIEFITNDTEQADQFAFVFNNIINSNTINFPVVVTDVNTNEPTIEKNLDIDTTLPPEKRKALIRELIVDMDELNQPIKIIQGEIVFGYLHYGQSALVTKLKTLPIIQFFVAGIFIFLGYFGFNYIKRTEQSNLWVGLSKETAHQLGTPLSSLMGWNELIKTNAGRPEKVVSLAEEMTHDLDRLNKIANRFSKIGSKADLREENIYSLVDRVTVYFEKRIPRIATGTFAHNPKSKIKLSISGSKTATALLNFELFEWVLENLTKNALDAIEGGAGSISFDIQEKGEYVFIDVADTGKGIDLRFKKDIFRPGYSTKMRGWGLGLSLSKRIVETYHEGKLFIKESEPGKGTTFRIRLNRNK